MIFLTIAISVLSASHTIQTMFYVYEKNQTIQREYMEELVKESVEYAYVTYIYEIKQQCKKDGVKLEYDMSNANRIANEFFYTKYKKPWFGIDEAESLKINKLIKDQLRFCRANAKKTTS